jgi:hypothetical protein
MLEGPFELVADFDLAAMSSPLEDRTAFAGKSGSQKV